MRAEPRDAALRRARPDGEEHMAKLSVNAIMGLWARSGGGLPRNSSSELDGAGADFSQAFACEGGMCELRLCAEAAETAPPHC